MTAKAFLEQYMDCMDALPLELQRFASQYWEIDNKARGMMVEAERIDSGSVAVLDEDASTRDKRRWLIQLQRLLISMMEVGTEKLDVTSQMLDTVEGYSQQLALAEKEMVSCRTRDELTGGSTTRNGGTTSTHSQHGNNNSKAVTQASLPALLEVVEKKKSERSQKRARTHDKAAEADHDSLSSNGSKEARRDSNTVTGSTGTTSTASLNVLQSSGSSSTTNTSSNKSIKKKVKAKKKSCVVKEQTQSATPTQPVPTVPAAVPTPDFTTEPIDPDEPTYCLCNQVSFGEMIGCDNEDCPIEWFHFQCVGLTAKPKGKWYCPQCHTERAKNRSGKT